MEIRQGTSDEMMSLWYKQFTSEFVKKNIESGKAEFWTIEENGRLIGELYIFTDLEDKHFAEGKKTAYLCAFRVIEEMRGKGYGTKLMLRVFDRLKDLDFEYATIGVELGEGANIRLYERLGFDTKVKISVVDPCDVDCNFKPVMCDEFLLLRKAL